MKRILITIFILISIYFSYHLLSILLSVDNFSLNKLEEELEKAKVIEVIDGDTIRIEGNYKVRLIGVNTPERGQKCYEEAKIFLKNLIEGKEVYLERDKRDKDKYGRLLRYVYYNSTMVNLLLVKEGYAVIFFDKENRKYSKELEEAYIYAKENKIGCLWKD